MGQPKHFLPPPRNVYFSHTGVGGKLKPFFTIDLKNFDLGSICLHKPFLKAASIIWPASNQGCAPQRSRAYSSGGAWDTLSRDCRGLAPVGATEEPNPIPNESGNTTAQLPNSQKERSSSSSLSCWAVGQLSCRTHYGQAFVTLWGLRSQSAAISCQASRTVVRSITIASGGRELKRFRMKERHGLPRNPSFPIIHSQIRRSTDRRAKTNKSRHDPAQSH